MFFIPIFCSSEFISLFMKVLHQVLPLFWDVALWRNPHFFPCMSFPLLRVVQWISSGNSLNYLPFFCYMVVSSIWLITACIISWMIGQHFAWNRFKLYNNRFLLEVHWCGSNIFGRTINGPVWINQWLFWYLNKWKYLRFTLCNHGSEALPDEDGDRYVYLCMIFMNVHEQVLS